MESTVLRYPAIPLIQFYLTISYWLKFYVGLWPWHQSCQILTSHQAECVLEGLGGVRLELAGFFDNRPILTRFVMTKVQYCRCCKSAFCINCTCYCCRFMVLQLLEALKGVSHGCKSCPHKEATSRCRHLCLQCDGRVATSHSTSESLFHHHSPATHGECGGCGFRVS